MAFPEISAITATQFASSVTSMAVNLPSSISAGDLLLAFVEVRNAGTWTKPSGWNDISSLSQAGGGSVGKLDGFYRIATGTEASTATWTASTTTTAIWQVRKVTGWHGTTPPEATTASGDASSANPPSLSPSWGTEDTLWVAVAGHAAASAAAFTAAPANYTDFTNSGASSGGAAVSIATAVRELNASSEDPGTFTAGGSNRWWAAATVAIRTTSSPPPRFAFLQRATNTAGRTTYDFTSQGFGVADADRTIIVGILARDAGKNVKRIDSVTIGGVSATVVVQRQNATTNSNLAGIAIATVPTGTSGTISVTFSEAVTRCGISVYRAVGLIGETPYDTASSTAGNPSFSYNYPANGIIIACSTTAATATSSMSGSFVENWDEQVSFNAMSSYSLNTGDYSTYPNLETLTSTITWTSSSESVGVLASWGFKGVDDWYDSDWTYRKLLVLREIALSGMSESVTDVPIYIRLSELDDEFWSNVKTDGADIRITSSDGVTELPVEVVFCNTGSKTGELYFKAPSVSHTADTYFYIYYGNTSASAYSPTDTYGRNNVWSNGYELVLHFQETTGSYIDSTGNGHDSTSVTATSRNATGKLAGNAVDLSGSSDVIEFGDILDMGTNDMTVSHWIKTSQTPANYAFTMSKSRASTGNYRYAVGIYGNPAKPRIFIQGDGGSDVDFSGGTTVNTNSWIPISYVFDRSGSANIYVWSASSDGSASISSWDTKDFQSNHPFRLGQYTGADNTSLAFPYNGLMDEFRLSFTIRSSSYRFLELYITEDGTRTRAYGQQEEGGGGGGTSGLMMMGIGV